MNNDLEEIWKGAFVAQFEVLPGDLPGVIEKNHVKVSQYPT